MSPFAEALRTLRFQLGLRQQELADLADCDRSYLSALETGLKPAASASFVDTLIAALKLSEAEAQELRRARERSRRTYSVAPDSPAEIYDFVFELFARLDRLSAKQTRALKAVLEIADANGAQIRPGHGRRAQPRPVGRDEPMEEAM
jgi:transcriptional regulator with XRE-family HTH domain